MTDAGAEAPPFPGVPGEHHFKISDRADAWLRIACDGNGLSGTQVRLLRHDTAVHALLGFLTIELKPQIAKAQKKGRAPQGEMLGTQAEVMARIDGLTPVHFADAAVQKEISAALDKDPGAGWEIPLQKITLNATRREFCTVDKCLKCAGQGQFSCIACNATGRSACKGCSGKGGVPCDACNATGRYKRGDGSLIPCSKCGADGFIECLQCNNKKILPCRQCNGLGRSACTECAASGWWTNVTSAVWVCEISFRFQREDAAPEVLALVDFLGSRALATEGHAEILRDAADFNGPNMIVPVAALFAEAEAVFSVEGKEKPAHVAGLHGRILRMEPFLDPYVKPGISALLKISKGGLATGALLEKALRYKLVKKTVRDLPGHLKKTVYQSILKEYGVILSDKYARATVKAGHEALVTLGRGPRLRGLALGTVLAGGIAAAWLFTPARAATLAELQRRMLEKFIPAADGAVWLAGWGAAVLAIRFMATRGVSRFLPQGEKPPLQDAGTEGLYALFTSAVAWLCAASPLAVRPEWLAALLKKFGI